MRNKIRPQFYWRIPKDAIRFLGPDSDDEFKAEHPVGYWVLVICGVTVLLSPMFLLLLFFEVFYPCPDSAWMLLGGAGAFIVGTGLFNLVAAWLGQYLGHLVTALCLGIGGTMVGASVLILYYEPLYRLFDEAMVSYYFFNCLFLFCLPPIYYFFFRGGVQQWLRTRKIRKSAINKEKKGMKNFWWYTGLHQTYGLGMIYQINRLFTIAYPAAVILHVLLGWLKIMSIPISVLFVMVYVLMMIMSLFISIQENKKDYGKAFILFAYEDGHISSSILVDLPCAMLPLILVYGQFQVFFEVWRIA